MKNIITFSFIFIIVFMAKAQTKKTAPNPRLEYTVSMSEPHTHYYEVQIKTTDLVQDYIDFKMPVWTPGSYLVREFAKSVEAFEAKTTKPIRWEKINKNTWRVYTDKANTVTINYKVYAYELSVRTSYLDASHGFISPTGVFMFVDKNLNLPALLTVKPYTKWLISTGLPASKKGKFTYEIENYDILADSPLELGTHTTLKFTSNKIPHEVAMYGEANYDKTKIVKDLQAITEEATKIFGENPCRDYTFIVHNLTTGSGGLEHLNSTVLQVSRWNYEPETNYLRFLSLAAHEYFHLWNVKRIRPKTLGPFDYDNENYTTMLWFSEGFTSYYDDLLVRRSNLMTTDYYLSSLVSNINIVENTPGDKVQSVAEASFDAWIKYYRGNENSNNTTVSYYNKGNVIGAVLDLEIMHNTQGQKSMDDVMRYLYEEYYKKQSRGFTEDELQKAIESIAGKNLNDFFKNYIYGTQALDYNLYLAYAGLKLQNSTATNGILGAATSERAGKHIITYVQRGTAAYNFGLNVNDEIIAIDNFRVGGESSIKQLLSTKKPGEKIDMWIARDGVMKNFKITLDKDASANYRIEKVNNPTAEQKKIYQKWLKTAF